MSDLTLIAGIPDVKGAVLGDLAGGLLDAVDEGDGETVAAVMGFLATAVGQVGQDLGLGPLERVSLSGEAQAHVVLVRGGSVVAARVERPAALSAVEKAIDGALQGGR
jgi:hypothetical protein